MNDLPNNQKKSPLKSLWDWFSIFSGILGLASMADTFVLWKGFIASTINQYQALVHPVFEFLFSWVPFTIPHFVFDYLVIGVIVGLSRFKAEQEISVLGNLNDEKYTPIRTSEELDQEEKETQKWSENFEDRWKSMTIWERWIETAECYWDEISYKYISPVLEVATYILLWPYTIFSIIERFIHYRKTVVKQHEKMESLFKEGVIDDYSFDDFEKERESNRLWLQHLAFRFLQWTGATLLGVVLLLTINNVLL